MRLVDYTKSGRLVVTVEVNGEEKSFTPSDRSNLFCYWFTFPEFDTACMWEAEWLGSLCINHEIE